VVVAGILTALRALGTTLPEIRVVLAGAGAAGIGIARLIRLAMVDAGMDEASVRRSIVLVDSHGLVRGLRRDLDEPKREFALSADEEAAFGFGPSKTNPGLVETIERVRPTVLVGTTAVGGIFDESVIRAMAAAADRPVILPLSNPTSKAEANPIDVLRWTDGRALVATGSPFDAVEVDGRRHEVGQANNVFIFPGLGLGAIAAEARTITPRMFLLAAQTLAAAVTDDRLASGALYPPVGALRSVSRAIAIRVARDAVEEGLAGIDPATDIEALIDGAMWWPAYVPYWPARPDERRRDSEA
jgi:malate dehydrogenase (oxaloacetate-decarboxylating)